MKKGEGLKLRPLLPHAVAVLSVTVATLVRLPMNPSLGEHSIFPTYFLAVIFSAWYGGWPAAATAMVGGWIAGDYFISPSGRPGDLSEEALLQLFLYVAVTGVAAFLATNLRTALFREMAQSRRILLETAERQRAEQQLLEARLDAQARELRALEEASRLKSEFLRTVTHELRTPLNSIIGFTDLVVSGHSGEINAEQKSLLEHVLHSGHGLLALINQILELARIDSGQVHVRNESLQVGILTHQLLDALDADLRKKGLRVSTSGLDDLPLVETDQRLLTQIVAQLLGNAVKFTPHGEVRVEAAVLPERIELSVIDTGIGIPAEGLSRIFEPFVQLDSTTGRRFEGTGLGLHLASRAAALLGADLAVESRPQEGSRFTLHLPLTPPASPRPAGLPS